jgi:hypothetical protein
MIAQAGQRDIARLAPAIRAVHSGGLVERRIDRRERGQVDDCRPAKLLEDTGADEHRAKSMRIAEQRAPIEANRIGESRHRPTRGQEREQHPPEDDPGEKVGEVRHDLDCALKDTRAATTNPGRLSRLSFLSTRHWHTPCHTV